MDVVAFVFIVLCAVVMLISYLTNIAFWTLVTWMMSGATFLALIVSIRRLWRRHHAEQLKIRKKSVLWCLSPFLTLFIGTIGLQAIPTEFDRDEYVNYSTPTEMETPMPIDTKQATDQELNQRQKLLEDEIEANEQENRLYQDELNKIYAEQDARKQK